MEKLGGGGHRDMAGVQLDTSLEKAYEMVVWCIFISTNLEPNTLIGSSKVIFLLSTSILCCFLICSAISFDVIDPKRHMKW